MVTSKQEVVANGKQCWRMMILIPVLCFWGLVVMAVFHGPALATETLESRYPELSSGILKSAHLSDLPDGVILESGSIVVNETDLRSLLDEHDPKLRSQLEQNLFFILEQEAIRLLLVSEAQAALGGNTGDDEQEIVGQYLETVAEKAVVTDEELRAFFEANQEMMGGASFDQVKDPVRQMLLQQKQGALVGEHINNLGRNRDIRLNGSWVEKQYAMAIENPVDKARQSGKPTMIEFGATGCIPCDKMQPILESLRKKFTTELNVVFVHVREQQILAARYNIRSIPVQVFFDAQGREVFRHEGFFAEEKILPILKDMGVE